MNTATRRGLLAGAAGLSVAPVAAIAAQAHPDAALLEACAAFDELEHRYINLGGDAPANSPEEAAVEVEQGRLSKAQQPFVARMCELRAVTREGGVARARSLALWNAELFNEAWQEDTGDRLTAAIVRDLVG